MRHPLHCLLIDDDVDDCEIFTATIAGINAAIRTDTMLIPGDAVARLQNGHYTPDIIFLDMNMPKLDGMDCLKLIRKMDGLQHTPVIIYSTSTSPRDMEQSRLDGATDYLIKPASMAGLQTELSRVFEKYTKNLR